MHYSLKVLARLFITISLLAALCGCLHQGATVSIDEKKYETENAVIKLQIPNFKNLPDSEFENSLNTEYNNMVDVWLEDFSQKSEGNTTSEKCRFELEQTLAYNKEPLISVVGEVFVYTEGMHGSSNRLAKNLDVSQNKILKLSDLFADEAYQQAINREINEILESDPEKYHDLWEKPILNSSHEDYFYLSNDGLVIFFPPYELSYYARGFVEFCIPYGELTGYLKPEYKGL